MTIIDMFLSLKKYLRDANPYNNYWRKHNVKKWSYGINIVEHAISSFEFNSVLDAGCGNCDVVRYFIEKGKDVKGIELSDYVLKKSASDLFKKEIVMPGSLDELPFQDNEFDLVFSTEVLEHIEEEKINTVLKELCRVAKKYLFLTISLRPSSDNNKYHITLRSRDWWEEQFLKFNLKLRHDIVYKLQKVNKKANVREIMMAGPTARIIDEIEWFVENPPHDFMGEYEPWYFVFEKIN